MSINILDPPIALKLLGCTQVVVYVDTIEPFFTRTPAWVLSSLRTLAAPKRVWSVDCKRDDVVHGQRLIINQPTDLELEYLNRLYGRPVYYCFATSKLHIAVDYITRTIQQAHAIKAYLRTHLILRWRSKGPLHDEVSTTYLVKFGVGQRRPNRNAAAYSDKPARTLPGNQPCCHLELRYLKSAAIRRAGFNIPAHLMDSNRLADAVNHNLYLLDFDAYLNQTLRRIADDWRKSLRSHPRVRSAKLSRFRETQEANIPGRVAGLFHRLGLDCAQIFKDTHPKRAARLPTQQLAGLVISRHSYPPPLVTS